MTGRWGQAGGESHWIPALSVEVGVQLGGERDEAVEVLRTPAECHCGL